MLCAIGIFVWSVFQSRREGNGITASFSPRRGGGLAANGYEELGRFNPPTYRDLGGAPANSPDFRTAISNYSQRDYQSAIDSLEAVVKRQPDAAEARFYLGICDLFTKKFAAGNRELRQVIATGDTPYLEQARYYLAKGLLAESNPTEAREQLDDVVAMHRDLEPQAESLLAQLR